MVRTGAETGQMKPDKQTLMILSVKTIQTKMGEFMNTFRTLFPFLIVMIAGSHNVKAGSYTLGSSITLDNVNNVHGGIRTGSSMLALFDFDLEYVFSQGLMENTRIYAHILKTAGYTPSERMIGDVQVASNIEGRSPHFFYELLIRRSFGHVDLSMGLHDLNADFMVSDFAGDLINSSFGISPTISLNVPVSIYPVTTFGGMASYQRRSVGFAAGFYNLNHEFADQQTFQPDYHFFQHGYLGIGELCYRVFDRDDIDGEYKFGSYYKYCGHEQHFHDKEICNNNMNYGFYFIGDQVLHRTAAGAVVGGFVQASVAPQTFNYATKYFGAGISVRHISGIWLPDQISLAIARVSLNDHDFEPHAHKASHETVIEMSAMMSVFEKVYIQPDFQVILNPAGNYDNALVGTLRITMELN